MVGQCSSFCCFNCLFMHFFLQKKQFWHLMIERADGQICLFLSAGFYLFGGFCFNILSSSKESFYMDKASCLNLVSQWQKFQRNGYEILTVGQYLKWEMWSKTKIFVIDQMHSNKPWSFCIFLICQLKSILDYVLSFW